jgi:hypothetical protein
VGNWKSEENINYFLENGFKELAKDFLERGYDFYVDGFTPKPTFRISYLEEDEDKVGYQVQDLSLHCQTFQFKDYKEMISILEEKGKDNYIFMFSIKPFEMRIATVSCRYNLSGIEHRKTRIREQKLNELLNE